MADYGATDISTTALSTNQFPVSAAYVPNDVLRPVGGGPKQTDSANKAYTSVLVYVQDGYDVTQGVSTDAANANSVIGQLKQIKSNTASVTVGSLPAISGTVTANAGTNLNTSALALDTSINGLLAAQGSTTSGQKGPLLQGAVTTSAPTYTTAQNSPISLTLAGAVRVDASATTQPVSGTFWQATQPVSAASLPLPTGAATAAKQPALGTAGTPSSDVLSVQGIASMIAFKVDGSGVTQPVSGTVTANAGTNLNTSLLALESGGNLAIVAGAITGAKAQTNTAQINGVAPAMGNGVSGTGVQRVTIASDSTGQIALAAGSNVVGSVTIQATSGTALQADQSNTILKSSLYVKKSAAGDTVLALGSATSANSLPVVIASDQGAVPVSQSGTWTVQPGNAPNTSAWLVQDVAGTTGGSTPNHLISGASNNATSLKASAGMVYGYTFSNTNAAARYVKFYNKASAPAPATDNVLIVNTIQVPANGTVIAAIPEGMVFSTGIAFAAVANMSDTDNTSIGAGDLSIDVRWK